MQVVVVVAGVGVRGRRGAMEKGRGREVLVPTLELVREFDGDDRRVDFLVVGQDDGGSAAAEHAAHGYLDEEVRLCGVLHGGEVCAGGGAAGGGRGGVVRQSGEALERANGVPERVDVGEEDAVVEFPDVALGHVDVVGEFALCGF